MRAIAHHTIPIPVFLGLSCARGLFGWRVDPRTCHCRHNTWDFFIVPGDAKIAAGSELLGFIIASLSSYISTECIVYLIILLNFLIQKNIGITKQAYCVRFLEF